MPKPFEIPNLFASVGKQMWLALNEALVSHPGELGTSREEVIREVFRKYLPGRYAVSTGFVFDHSGATSKQIDGRDLRCIRVSEIRGGWGHKLLSLRVGGLCRADQVVPNLHR